MDDNKQLANTEDEIKQLVIARLSVLSPDTVISIGSEGNFTPEELIERIENGDPVGKKIEAVQMEWLRSLKEGVV